MKRRVTRGDGGVTRATGGRPTPSGQNGMTAFAHTASPAGRLRTKNSFTMRASTLILLN